MAIKKLSLDFPATVVESSPLKQRKESYSLQIEGFKLHLNLIEIEELFSDLENNFREEDSWRNVESKLESIKVSLRTFKASCSHYSNILCYMPEKRIERHYNAIVKRVNELDTIVKFLKSNYVKPLFSPLEGSVLCDRYLFSQQTSSADTATPTHNLRSQFPPLGGQYTKPVELGFFVAPPSSTVSPSSPKPS